ncbi:MAG: S16 family serine protease [Candidatus Nanopelagicales bacterium]|nr:S16 family serine protease [Candidatus Nanopelagicales bacterium]
MAKPVRSVASGVLTCAVLATLLTSCGLPGGPDSVTVTALWFGRAADGTPTAGTEPVTITVERRRPSEFTLDLQTGRDQGAGPAWDAAAWGAATAATLASHSDPRTLRISYSITGEIDGPSAGGIMTVGVLAALNDAEPLPDVTMTGTIAPDGSIGNVGGIPSKIRAAKDAGFASVVIPEAGVVSRDTTTGTDVNTVELGRSLGIAVKPVASLMQAYQIVVGGPTPPDAAVGGPLPEGARSLLARRAESYLDEAAALLERLEGKGGARRATAVSTLEKGKAALIEGRIVDAYSDATAVLAEARGLIARTGTVVDIDRLGTTSVRGKLQQENIDATAKLMEQSRDLSPQLPGDLERVANGADALSWVTDALVDLRRVNQSLAGSVDSDKLADAADLQAQALFEGVEVASDVAAVAAQVSSRPAPTDMADALDGWVNFLDHAGDSLMNYFDKVHKIAGADSLSTYSQATAHGVLVDELRSVRDSATQLLALAATQSYYIYASALVADAGGLIKTRDGLGLERIVDPVSIDALTAVAVASNRAVFHHLDTRGLNTAYLEWNSRWGSGLATGTSGPGTGRARTFGLTYMWFMYVNGQILSGLAELD